MYSGGSTCTGGGGGGGSETESELGRLTAAGQKPGGVEAQLAPASAFTFTLVFFPRSFEVKLRYPSGTALMYSPRLDPNVVVQKSWQHGLWSAERRDTNMTFARGRPFTVPPPSDFSSARRNHGRWLALAGPHLPLGGVGGARYMLNLANVVCPTLDD